MRWRENEKPNSLASSAIVAVPAKKGNHDVGAAECEIARPRSSAERPRDGNPQHVGGQDGGCAVGRHEASLDDLRIGGPRRYRRLALAHEKGDVDDMPSMAIVKRLGDVGKLSHRDLERSFLLELAHDCLRDRLAGLLPSARQSPQRLGLVRIASANQEKRAIADEQTGTQLDVPQAARPRMPKRVRAVL